MSKGRRKREKPVLMPREYGFDFTLFIAIILLISFGLIMLYSISYHTGITANGDHAFYLKRQMTFAVIGLVGMYLASKWYPILYYISDYFMAVSMLLVVLVLFIGVQAGGASRWLEIGGIQFQPSELVKVGTILWVSKLLCDCRRSKITAKQALKISGFVIVVSGLVSWITTNLSTALIIAGIGIGMTIIMCGNANKIMGYIIAFGIAGATFVKMFGEYLLTMSGGFRMKRILVWIDVNKYSQQGGYQVLQSLYAIGAGGFWGKGLGNGMQKLSSIPEVQNDMIFAAICEELGLFGVLIIFTLFGVIIYRLYKISVNAATLYESLVVAGIMLHIAIQVLFNMAVVTAVFPNTGVTLPFISYGGTALVIVMCELGIALGVSRKR